MEHQSNPQDLTQAEILEDAAKTPDDPITHREELELELMEEHESQLGEELDTSS